MAKKTAHQRIVILCLLLSVFFTALSLYALWGGTEREAGYTSGSGKRVDIITTVDNYESIGFYQMIVDVIWSKAPRNRKTDSLTLNISNNMVFTGEEEWFLIVSSQTETHWYMPADGMIDVDSDTEVKIRIPLCNGTGMSVRFVCRVALANPEELVHVFANRAVYRHKRDLLVYDIYYGPRILTAIRY